MSSLIIPTIAEAAHTNQMKETGCGLNLTQLCLHVYNSDTADLGA